MNETELQSLLVRLVGDGSSYQKMLRDAQSNTARAVASLGTSLAVVDGLTLRLRGFASSAVSGFAALTGAALGAAGVFKSVKLAGEMEDLQISFRVLTGDANVAKASLKELTKFAADTPFQLPEVLNAAKQMLAFGETADNIVPTMRMLGDVASALEIPLGQLTYVFGTLKAQGRAFTHDINQFATRGIPIWAELGKQFGKSNDEIRKMVEEGKVGFADIEKAFKSMTGPGGRFFGIMEEKSKGFFGLLSNLADNVGAAMTKVGDVIIAELNLKAIEKWAIEMTGVFVSWLDSPVVKSAIRGAGQLVEWFKDTVVTTFLRGKAAVEQFWEANSKLILQAGAAVVAFKAVQLAARGVAVAIGVVNGLLTLLKVKQVLGIALWVAYAAVMAVVKIGIGAFAAVVFVLNTALAMASAAWAIYTAATTAAGIATSVFEVILAVLEAELIVPLIAAVIVLAAGLAVLGAAFLAAGSAGYALLEAGKAVFELFANIPLDSGPLGEIGRIFGEWWEMLKQVYAVAQNDIPAAFALLKLSAAVAVNQVKDLWPPLWEFVKVGWAAVATVAGGTLKAAFREAGAEIVRNWADVQEATGFGDAAEQSREMAKQMDTVAALERDRAKKDAKAKVDAALEAFKVVESAETKAAKEARQTALQEIAEWSDNPGSGGGEAQVEAAKKTGAAVGSAYGTEVSKHASAALHKFDAAAQYSAEAFSRVWDYQDRIGANRPMTDIDIAKQQIASGVFTKPDNFAPQRAPDIMTTIDRKLMEPPMGNKETLDVLKAIHGELKGDRGTAGPGGVNLQFADLGG